MTELEDWLESNRERLERAGFTLEVGGDDKTVTVVGETPLVVFSLIEWPGLSLEFDAVSYAEDKGIPVVEADSDLSVNDRCEFYLRQIEAYVEKLLSKSV